MLRRSSPRNDELNSRRRRRHQPRARGVLLQDASGGVDLLQRDVVAPEVGEVLQHPPGVAEILQKESIRPIQKEAALRGIADKIVVYEIP